MANFKVEDWFNKTTVSPSGLIQGQIVEFNYQSPKGVTDKKPLVYVYEKRVDRFYGINLHYGMDYFTEILNQSNIEINKFLEECYKRDAENRKKLIEEYKGVFTKELITEDEYKDMIKNYPKKQLEEFVVQNPNMNIMRQYIYGRMTQVKKLTYKV